FQENGDLIVNGEIAGNITPSSPTYFFLKCLWLNFNQPVSHEDIFSYSKAELTKINGLYDFNEYTPQTFCNKMKSEIKKKAVIKVIDDILKATRTQEGKNAYRLTHPL